MALARSILLLNIAIVTDESNCTCEFAHQLKESLEELKESKFNIQHIVYEIHAKTNQHSEFYQLKEMDAAIIILLVPVYYINVVIQEANYFSLLDNSHIWLITNYKKELVDSISPNHVFTIDFPEIGEPGSIFNTLATSLPGLLSNYDKYKDTCEKRLKNNFCFCWGNVCVNHP